MLPAAMLAQYQCQSVCISMHGHEDTGHENVSRVYIHTHHAHTPETAELLAGAGGVTSNNTQYGGEGEGEGNMYST